MNGMYKFYVNFHKTIFRIIQHFTTKLCHFTKFEMIFLAVLIDFVLLAMFWLKLRLK